MLKFLQSIVKFRFSLPTQLQSRDDWDNLIATNRQLKADNKQLTQKYTALWAEYNQLIEHLVSSSSSPSARPVDLDQVLDDEDLAIIEQFIKDFPENQEDYELVSGGTHAETETELFPQHKDYTLSC